MRRTLTILLAAALLLGLLSGCGSAEKSETAAMPESAPESAAAGETEEGTAAPVPDSVKETAQEAEASASEEAPEETEPPEPPYFPLEEAEHLSMWFAYPPIFSEYADGPEEYLIFTEAASRLNVDLEIIGVSMAGAGEQFNLMIASGEYPDIIQRFGGYYQNSLDSALDDEIAFELTDYLDAWAPDFQKVRTRDEQTERITATADGRVAGFYTFETNGAPDTGPFIRADYLAELGQETPETLEDWAETLDGFYNTYGAALGLPSGGMTKFASIESNFGITSGMFQVDGNVRFGQAEPGFRDYLDMMNDWFAKGYICRDFFSEALSASSYMTDQNLISSGAAGIFFGNLNTADAYAAQILDENAKVEPLAYPVSGGEKNHFASVGMPQLWGVISTDCENPELAARFLNYYFTDEGRMLANYGVEGLTYEMVDGKPKYTEIIRNNPEGMNLDVALTLYTCGVGSICTVVDNDKNLALYSDLQNAAVECWRSQVDDENTILSVSMTVDEATEYYSLMSDIQTYYEQAVPEFIMGNRPLSEFDAYVDTLNSMGLDRCIEIYQTAYDRFMGRTE